MLLAYSRAIAHINGFIRERGRGKFPQTCEAKALQERFGGCKAQPAVGSGGRPRDQF